MLFNEFLIQKQKWILNLRSASIVRALYVVNVVEVLLHYKYMSPIFYHAISTYTIIFLYKLLVYKRFNFMATHACHLGFY